MKIQVTFKTPDVLDPTVDEHCRYNTMCKEHDEHDPDCGLCIQAEERAERDIEAIKKCANKFIQYGEYVTIELDTETQTAIVKPVK